ncbi:MAG: hypothetical protein GX678_00810 [Actinomycetales bacterium]|nr:hypothetical protein [Actinomycetales bacterium]
MAYRHRPKYDDSVTDRLIGARAQYDREVAEHEERVAKTRRDWSAELASAIESGMSYEEIVQLVNVSHSSVARAMREFRKNAPTN